MWDIDLNYWFEVDIVLEATTIFIWNFLLKQIEYRQIFPAIIFVFSLQFY